MEIGSIFDIYAFIYITEKLISKKSLRIILQL